MTFTPPADALTITFPQPAPLLNMNSRQHWAVKAREVAAWRRAAFYAATAAKCPPQPASFLQLTLPVPTNRRRDGINLTPCTKAATDGIVDAGVFDDDDLTRVTTLEPRLVVTRDRTVTVHIWPREVVS